MFMFIFMPELELVGGAEGAGDWEDRRSGGRCLLPPDKEKGRMFMSSAVPEPEISLRMGEDG